MSKEILFQLFRVTDGRHDVDGLLLFHASIARIAEIMGEYTHPSHRTRPTQQKSPQNLATEKLPNLWEFFVALMV